MNQRSYAIGLIALAPLLFAKSCPDSKGKSIEATTNDFEIEVVDANIANNQLSASGIQFRRKAGNSQQMTDAEITFWDDVDGDGVIDEDEERITPFKTGGGGPTDDLALEAFRFEVGGRGSKHVNAYKGSVTDAQGNKQEFQGAVGQ